MDIQWILDCGSFFRVSFKIPLKTRLSTEVRGQKVLQVAYSGHSNGVTGLSGCSIDSLASFRALGPLSGSLRTPLVSGLQRPVPRTTCKTFGRDLS